MDFCKQMEQGNSLFRNFIENTRPFVNLLNSLKTRAGPK